MGHGRNTERTRYPCIYKVTRGATVRYVRENPFDVADAGLVRSADWLSEDELRP
jgi:hypothetical protein